MHNWLYVETTSEVPLKAKGARRFSSSQSTPGMDIVGKDDQPKGSTGNTIAAEGLSATVHYYLQIVMLLILDTSNLGLSNDLYVNQVEEVHLSFQNDTGMKEEEIQILEHSMTVDSGENSLWIQCGMQSLLEALYCIQQLEG